MRFDRHFVRFSIHLNISFFVAFNGPVVIMIITRPKHIPPTKAGLVVFANSRDPETTLKRSYKLPLFNFTFLCFGKVFYRFTTFGLKNAKIIFLKKVSWHILFTSFL